MMKLESTLHVSKPLVQDVTTKLGIFASVWAAVSSWKFRLSDRDDILAKQFTIQITADIRKLKNSLHHAEDPTSKVM